MLIFHLEQRVTRHRDFYGRLSFRMKRFPRVSFQHSFCFRFDICNLQFHSGESSILGQPVVRIEILSELNKPIQVAMNFSLLPKYTENDGTRHVAPSRNSAFPVMEPLYALRVVSLGQF